MAAGLVERLHRRTEILVVHADGRVPLGWRGPSRPLLESSRRVPKLLPPADETWELRRPARLIALTIFSLLAFLAMIWVQTHDAEILEAAAQPEIPAVQPGPSLTVTLGLLIVYLVPLLLWLGGLRWMLHVMAVLCVLGLVVFTLSAANGLLWNLWVGGVPALGALINLGWLLVAYRRGLG